MSASENIAKAKALKEEGNEAFKAGEYKKAMVAYHQVRNHTGGLRFSPQFHRRRAAFLDSPPTFL